MDVEFGYRFAKGEQYSGNNERSSTQLGKTS